MYITKTTVEKDEWAIFLWSVKNHDKLGLCDRTPQNLQQNPQPLFPLQQLQHKVQKCRWLWRFSLMWLGIWVRGEGRKYSQRHSVYRLLVWRKHWETPWGKHIHLNFNLLMVIGLICAVNWTYRPWVHWHFLMCHNWSVIALCLLQLPHLGNELCTFLSHPDKTFTANKQMKWV